MPPPNTTFDDVLSSLPGKVSWEELCKKLGDVGYTTNDCQNNNDGDTTNNDSEDDKYVHMSRQLLSLRGPMNQRVVQDYDTNRKILSVLRWEDATHIPLLRVDSTGEVIDWNRSMTDLTGVPKAQVVGKKYVDVLNEWIMQLTEGYKDAAVEWAATYCYENGGDKKQRDSNNQTDVKEKEEAFRKDYLFPLPLPIKIPNSDENGSEYIELLALKVEHLLTVYPNFNVLPDSETVLPPGWIGGTEFTLRKQLPSLQTLCSKFVPRGSLVNKDGSVKVAAAASTNTAATSNNQQYPTAPTAAMMRLEANAAYPLIERYINSCNATGLQYMREVLWCVRNAVRKGTVTKKVLTAFSEDWTTNIHTSSIHPHILHALGGGDIIAQSIEKGKLTWRLAFPSSKSLSPAAYIAKDDAERKRWQWDAHWTRFTQSISQMFGENKHAIPLCEATDAPSLIPGPKLSERTLLTLKIEGVERCTPFEGSSRLMSWATVLVPATLNFFQLHRVVCQTMNANSCCERECHQWRSSNVAVYGTTSLPKDTDNWYWDYVQIGDIYPVQGGRQVKKLSIDDLFYHGNAIRQRISRTGSYFDQPMPLYEREGYILFAKRNNYVGKIRACISTCISSIFFQVGEEALLQNGFGRNFVKYKVSCKRIDEFGGHLPQNPKINALQPRCIRGKADEHDDLVSNWSVAKANDQLQKDRGVLRRNLCNLSSPDCMQQMPWCETRDCDFKVYERTLVPKPLATDLRGLNVGPMFLHGQPPLPGSPGYVKYVSSLRGRIDPHFLQENLVDQFGEFCVPYCPNRKPGDWDAEHCIGDMCIGRKWELEVDEEMERINSLLPITKQKAKRKAAMM